MALLHVDGIPYDSPTAAAPRKWTTVSISGYGSNLTVQTSSGRFGGRWLNFSCSTSQTGSYVTAAKTFGGTSSTIIAQFGYLPIVNNAGTIKLMQLRDGTAPQITLNDNAGILEVRRGDYNGTLLGAASLAISTNVWHQIEVKAVINNSAGSVLIKVDGVTLIDISGADTQATANAYANGISFEAYGMHRRFGLSDLVVMDTSGSYCNDLLGSIIVELKSPTGDGYYHDFVPLTGSDNYAMVDDLPPDDDTSYNTGSVGDRDTFTFDDIANVSATIHGVACTMFAKLNDGGSASVKGMVRSNGVDAEGAAVAVPSSYDFLQDFIYVDPNTSQPFTVSSLNSAEFGYKRES